MQELESEGIGELFDKTPIQEPKAQPKRQKISLNRELRTKQDEIRELEKTKKAEDRLILRKSKALSYLDSVQEGKIADKETRGLIQATKTMQIEPEKKAYAIKRLMAENNIRVPLNKMKKVGFDKFANKAPIEEAKRLLEKRRESYTDSDVEACRILAKTLNEAIQGQVRASLSSSLKDGKGGFNIKTATLPEKMLHAHRKFVEENGKRKGYAFFGDKYNILLGKYPSRIKS